MKAFEVKGEMDPSLGTPQTAEEYLKMVRWETNHLPALQQTIEKKNGKKKKKQPLSTTLSLKLWCTQVIEYPKQHYFTDVRKSNFSLLFSTDHTFISSMLSSISTSAISA